MTIDRVYSKIPGIYGQITVDPMPSDDELTAFYTNIYFKDLPSKSYQVSYNDEELAWKRLVVERLLYAIQKQLGGEAAQRGGLLDVGFGEGFMLEAAHKAGLEVLGIDFDQQGLERFHPHLLDKVTLGHPMQVLKTLRDQGAQYAVGVLLNVLEHAPDPAVTLELVASVIKPEGVIAVTVPNDFSPIQAEIMRRGMSDREYWFAPPQHLHYFNTESIQRLAAQSGFKVVDLFTDFPVEFFLFHPGSNYMHHPEAGKPAHHARVALELLLARNGLEPFLAFSRAMAHCGMGRALTVLLVKE